MRRGCGPQRRAALHRVLAGSRALRLLRGPVLSLVHVGAVSQREAHGAGMGPLALHGLAPAAVEVFADGFPRRVAGVGPHCLMDGGATRQTLLRARSGAGPAVGMTPAARAFVGLAAVTAHATVAIPAFGRPAMPTLLALPLGGGVHGLGTGAPVVRDWKAAIAVGKVEKNRRAPAEVCTCGLGPLAA